MPVLFAAKYNIPSALKRNLHCAFSWPSSSGMLIKWAKLSSQQFDLRLSIGSFKSWQRINHPGSVRHCIHITLDSRLVIGAHITLDGRLVIGAVSRHPRLGAWMSNVTANIAKTPHCIQLQLQRLQNSPVPFRMSPSALISMALSCVKAKGNPEAEK